MYAAIYKSLYNNIVFAYEFNVNDYGVIYALKFGYSACDLHHFCDK